MPLRGDGTKGAERDRRAELAGEASAEAAVASARTDASAPLPTPTDLTAAAFFDVDNTMMMGASMFHFARGLAAAQVLQHRPTWPGSPGQQVKFRVGGKESPEGINASRERALSFIAGRSVAELVGLGEEIYDELMADKIWAGTRALAQMHLDAGQRVWLVTATPVELGADHRPPARADRRAGHRRRERRRRLHRPPGRRAAARQGEGARGPRASPPARASTCAAARPTRTRSTTCPMLSVARHRRRRQPRPGAARTSPQTRLGDPRLPHRPQSRQDHRPIGPRRGRARRRGSRRHRLPPPRLLTPATFGAWKAAFPSLNASRPPSEHWVSPTPGSALRPE